jgi:peptidoglycan/xylan/chitin deacetylase (PgdA/CDA1 family)
MFWLIWLLIALATPWLFFYALWRVKYRKSSRGAACVLACHQVSDSLDLSITRQRVSQFEREVRFLHDQGYRVVGLKEAAGPEKGADRKRVALTFDDAFDGVYQNAFPLLRRFGFTACLFVVTGYVGKESKWDYGWGRNKRRHLGWEEIREMAQAGFEVGSHTVNHPDLTRIPRKFVEYELGASKQTIEDRLGQTVDLLSYPFGRFDRYVQQEAERQGYKGAYTLRRDGRRNPNDSFARPRWGVYLLDSPLSLKIKIDSGKLLWMEEVKGRIINAFSGWTAVAKGWPDYTKIDRQTQATMENAGAARQGGR